MRLVAYRGHLRFEPTANKGRRGQNIYASSKLGIQPGEEVIEVGHENSRSLNQCRVQAPRRDEGHEAERQWDSTRRDVKDEYPRLSSLILRRCVGEGSVKRRGQNICVPPEGMVDALLRVSKV